MKIIHLETIDSTNSYAQDHCKNFPQDQITCIYAEFQTAGRGRFRRTWFSPKSQNIYATFAFFLPIKTNHLTSLAQVMMVSLSQVLIKEGFDPKIKWPNDVQLNGKKLSGVLCETRFDREHVELFLGIGVNVNMTREELAQINQKATSLREETGKSWDRDLLLQKLRTQFATDLEKFKKKGFTPFHSHFEHLLAYRGETVSCFDGKKEWVGVCHSITDEGQLNLRLPNGETHVIVSGDLSN